MGIKIVRTEKKKKKEKKVTEEEKLIKHRIQYTKIAVSIMLFITVVVVLGSLYINLKTESNMDMIAVEILQTFWKIFVAYGVKSYLETKQEKKLESISKNTGGSGDADEFYH